MKESSLKTTRKRYSRNKFSKIPNYYEDRENKVEIHNNIIATIIGTKYRYTVKILPSERFSIIEYFKKNNIDYSHEENWTMIYLKNKEDVNTFFNEVRGKREVPLYVLLRGLLYSINDIEYYIHSITILSSTERYIQKYKVKQFKNLFNTILMLFKMVSTYRLHCYCQYKLTKNGLVISLIHSKYSKNVYNENRKEIKNNEE